MKWFCWHKWKFQKTKGVVSVFRCEKCNKHQVRQLADFY